MRQVFYIEADEEIISVVDRLRNSRAEENIFVFPQGALVLRSIVNLYLFERESKKRGKHISIVTQDETGRLMAEKVGIPVQVQLDKNAEDLASGAVISQETRQQWTYPQPLSDATPSQMPVRSLGTADFFGQQHHMAVSETPVSEPVSMPPISSPPAPPEKPIFPSSSPLSEYAQVFSSLPASAAALVPASPMSSPTPTPVPEFLTNQSFPRPAPQADGVRRIVVRDRSPRPLVVAKAAAPSEPVSQVQSSASETKPSPTPGTISGVGSGKLSLSSEFTREATQSSKRPEIVLTPSKLSGGTMEPRLSQEVSNFFTPKNHPTPESAGRSAAPGIKPAALGMPEPAPKDHVSRTWGKWLAVTLIGVVVVGLGAAALILLPRADVAITFKTTTAETDARFEAGTPVLQSADQTQQLQTRLLETEQTITKSFSATGSGTTADARVHGKVTIRNAYSTDPQTLIATTRVLSAEGKLFRLKDTVTVPGMQNGQPGSIDAEVVADQVGADYAIPAGSFTIPGLDGTPKQGKFTVASKTAFAGGGKQNGALASVSSADIVKARQVIEKELRATIEANFRQQLADGEQILPEAIEITTVAADSAPLVGMATDTFEYTWQVKARTLAFSETAVRTMLRDRFLTQAKDASRMTLDPNKIVLEYGQPEADMDRGYLRFSVHARSALQPAVNIETLKQELLGKSESSLKGVVASHPEIASIEVDFGKLSLWQTIPSRASQVTVVLKYLGE